MALCGGIVLEEALDLSSDRILTECMNEIFPPENRAIYEVMWENMVQPDRPQMTVWRMRIAC